MQYMCKDGVVFRVKPGNKANTRPLINSTTKVIVDSGKQSTIGDSVC